MIHKSVAIIGAGLSAAVCAKALNGLVKKISVFERSSFVGGRLHLTESTPTSSTFTVSTPFFQQVVDRWMLEGIVSQKQRWRVEIIGTEVFTLNAIQEEYCGSPTPISLVDNLLKDVSVMLNTEVVELDKSGQQWRLFDFDGGYLGLYDCVIFSAATASMYELVKSSKYLLNKFKTIDYSSAWSVVLRLKEEVACPYDNAMFIESALYNAYFDGNTVVLMATPEWSNKFSALPSSEAAKRLTDIYCQHTETNRDAIESSMAAFWPNKSPINTLNEDCFFDEMLGLGACGDWCTSPRVEGAVLSGFSSADRVMKYLLKGMD